MALCKYHYFLSEPIAFRLGYDVFEVDDLLVDSKFLYTFDDVSDIKDVRGEVWAQVNGSLLTVTGVRGGAVKTLGDTGTILLSNNPWGRLIYITVNQHTFSLWLLYQCRETNAAQSFFPVGNQENGGRGAHLYQEDGSREDLTFKLTVSGKSASLRLVFLNESGHTWYLLGHKSIKSRFIVTGS